MPRQVPSSITALIGQQNLREPLWLVRWELASGTVYLSSGVGVTYGGNAYETFRVKSVSGLTAQYLDRNTREFGRASFTFDNLANDGSSNFPFVALDAAGVLEDRKMTVYLYFPDAADAVLFWWGYSGRPKFNDADHTVEVPGTFLWDSSEIAVPTKTLPEAGFATLESNRNSDIASDEFVVPLVFGAGDLKVRPTISSYRVADGYVHVNGVVSGCNNGLPFQSSDMPLAGCKIFNVTQATELEFVTGSFSQTASPNLTRFPDGEAHEGVAHFYAAFPVTDEQKTSLDNLEPDAIKLTLANGRPLAATSAPSENPVRIIEDILRDPVFGLGLASGDFDSTALSAAASYVSGKFQSRLEIHERRAIGDLLQEMLTEFGGFLTFNNGKIQIGVKTPSESSVATFATVDSGESGRKIHNDVVNAYEKSFGDVLNSVLLQYRKKNRHPRKILMYDATAQTRPGGTIKKPVEATLELPSLYDEEQVQICGAITLREDQNGNLYCEFSTPVLEGIGVAPGDIITVHSPAIFNNASNYLFRVIAQTPETGGEQLLRFDCKVYKPAIYDYNTDGIGSDLLRGSTDTSRQGRPPDVTPVSLQVVDFVTNDTEGKQAVIRGTWTYPTVDLESELSDDNVAREYPIAAVQLWWHYSGEFAYQARRGIEVRYPITSGDFLVDHLKSKTIVCWFVALGHNRSRAPLGLIPDPTKETYLTASLNSTNPTASVAATAQAAVNDYIFMENEIGLLTSKTSNSMTFQSSGGNRIGQFQTTPVAHAAGTEVVVGKVSYPFLSVPLTAPRFTYPVVSSLVARQRHDGVRFVWGDPNAENKEVFYLYWSTDGDALSNAAKLGSTTPTWYTTDPNTPPSGVNLIKTDANSEKVLQELIGVAGTNVAARVAARNGKFNFSSVLSGSAQSKLGDDAVPTVALAPRTVIKKQGVRVVVLSPTLNMNTFATAGKNEVVIKAVNSGGATLGYLSDSTGAWTSSATEYKFDYGLARGHTFNINRESVLALWATATQLKIYSYITNAVGTSAASPEATITVSTWEVSDLAADTAAPGSLPTPILKMKRGKLFAKSDMATITNIQTLKDRVELCIHDSTDSLNLDDPTSEVKVSGLVFYQVGVAGRVHPQDLEQLRKIFGKTASLRARFRFTNDVGSTTSSDSAAMALSGQSDVTTLYNASNILRNGHFTYHSGTVAKKWQDYDPRTGIFGNVDQTGKLRFDANEHRARWRDTSGENQRFLAQVRGKRFMRSEYYSLIWNMYSNGTPTLDEVVVGLYTQKTLTNTISHNAATNTGTGSGLLTDGVKIGTVIGDGTEWRTVTGVTATTFTVDRNWANTVAGVSAVALIPQSDRLVLTNLSLTTADLFLRGLIQTHSDLDTSLNIYFVVVLRDNVDTTTFPYIDAICMNSGQESAGFQFSVDSYETNDDGTSEDFDTEPTGGSSSGGSQLPGAGTGDPGEVIIVL